jgi:hypothetical protein
MPTELTDHAMLNIFSTLAEYQVPDKPMGKVHRLSNTKDWVQIVAGYHPRGISHVQDTNNLHGMGYPGWGDSTTAGHAQVYTEVFDACTDYAASKTSSATASRAPAPARAAAGKYQDAVVITTNPPEASLTYSSACNVATPSHVMIRCLLMSRL